MRVVTIALVVLLAACNRAPRTGSGGDRQVIRAEEIATIASVNAYDAVAKLRPEFLRARGPMSGTDRRAVEAPVITVYLDGVEAGPTTVILPQIRSAEVVEIRMYRSSDATLKFGSRHAAGVIEVTTIRQARP